MEEDNGRKYAQIAAKSKGPGPGRYLLPSTCGKEGHDISQKKAASYSFGKYLGSSFINKVCSPGPVYRVDPELTRHGKDGTARYTQQGRHAEISVFNTPGPGRYHNEDCHPQGERNAPKYSMGSRTRYRKSDNYPSANHYNLPSLMGPKIPNMAASSAFTMKSRRQIGSFTQDLSKTPGPARYDIVPQDRYSQRPPQFSMLARRFVPGDKTNKPGPGKYYPENVKINKKSVPKYSMGIRHSEYIAPLISCEPNNE